jgi:hypothetical protein
MLQNGSRYNNALIIVHWLTFMLIVLSYASIEGREFFERGTQMRDNAKYTHFVIGLSILLTTFARIIFRLTSQVPASLSSSPKWITKVSKFGHFVFVGHADTRLADNQCRRKISGYFWHDCAVINWRGSRVSKITGRNSRNNRYFWLCAASRTYFDGSLSSVYFEAAII